MSRLTRRHWSGQTVAIVGAILLLVWWMARQTDAPDPGVSGAVASSAGRPGDASQQPVPAGANAPAAQAQSGRLRDLARDEDRGGHTLARHVARSDQELRERLERERGISAASTYLDRDVAARIVARTLDANSERISRWIARGERRPNLALDYRGRRDEVIGRLLERGRTAPVSVTDAVVVLRADDDDYFVLTSYPERRR